MIVVEGCCGVQGLRDLALEGGSCLFTRGRVATPSNEAKT